MQGKQQGRCVVWIISCALKIHCNPRTPLGGNQLVQKCWTEWDDRVVQKIYVIWSSFCILGKSFARPFKVKGLPFPWSCFFWKENQFFFIWNNEKWLNLRKIFWKVYYHSTRFGWYYSSFVFSTSITILKAWP